MRRNMKRIMLAIAILAVCFNAYALDTGDLTVRGDVEFSKYTTNGFLKTTGGTGTVAVDAASGYLLTDGSNANSNINIATYNLTTSGILQSSSLKSNTIISTTLGAPTFTYGLKSASDVYLGDVDDGTRLTRSAARIFCLYNVINYSPDTSYGFETDVKGGEYGSFTEDVDNAHESFSLWLQLNTPVAASNFSYLYTSDVSIICGVAAGAITFSWYDTTALAYKTATSTTTMVLGSWYHICGTLDSNTLTLYINGVSEDTESIATPKSSAAALYIFNGGSGTTESSVMDDLVVWKGRTITAAEAAEIYAAGSGLRAGPHVPFASTSTLMGTDMSACYNFDENTGLVAYDSSGNANNAVLTVNQWNTGFTFGSLLEETRIIESKDGVGVGEKGITTFGDSNSRTILDGQTIRFNIGGTEVGQIDANGNLSLTGSTTMSGYVKTDQSTPDTITGGTPIIEQNLKFQTSVYATGAKAGVTTMVSTATSIAGALLSYGMIQKDLDDPADQSGELQDGVQGQMVTIQLLTKAAGNYVLTPTRKTGYTTLTFDTAKDSITLLYLDGINGWIIVGNNGVTVN